jgi:twitching motility protein PilT
VANDVDALLRDLVARGGSDLHLVEGLVAKGRVHGVLEALTDGEPPVARWVDALLDERHRRTFDAAGDVDFAYEVADCGRFRVNVFRHHRGVGAVFRAVPRVIPSLDDLHLPEEVARFTTLTRGLVLVTGPTGSGKSSTLAALLDRINKSEARHVITIEDPIEFLHEDARSTFTQREIGRDTESFADALRSAARQDPDQIQVGEMRDKETMQLAHTHAEMGILVF